MFYVALYISTQDTAWINTQYTITVEYIVCFLVGLYLFYRFYIDDSLVKKTI